MVVAVVVVSVRERGATKGCEKVVVVNAWELQDYYAPYSSLRKGEMKTHCTGNECVYEIIVMCAR